MLLISAFFPMSAKGEEDVFVLMVIRGSVLIQEMYARVFPHILYLLEELKHFIENVMPELPDNMEG